MLVNDSIYEVIKNKFILSSKSDARKGSITIEASLVLPVFVFAMFLVLSLLNLLRFHMSLNEEIHQVVKEMAMEAYSDWDYSEGSVKAEVLERIDEVVLNAAPIESVDAIDFSKTDLSNREIITVQADYIGRLPYDFFHLFNYQFTAKCTMHSYIGYENGLFHKTIGEFENEEYVYVTETGTVYHRDLECSYLRLSIKETTVDEVKNLRNTSGHKYYACEKCGKNCNGKIYITTDGTAYHGSLGCSGLKRTVKCVPISEVSGMKPCSRCGGRH